MKSRWIAAGMIIVGAACLAACGSGTETPAAQVATAGFTPQSVCVVPDVGGLEQGAASDMLVMVGLQPVITARQDLHLAQGQVISQKPEANSRLSPCQGEVLLTVSAGKPAPTATHTPVPPTDTPTPASPTATPTPDPRLFWDDFERGISPEWDISGDNYTMVGGRLTSEGHLDAMIGNAEWSNYAVTFTDLAEIDNFQAEIRVHVHDRNNYMLLSFRCSNGCRYGWSRVIDGKAQDIPSANGDWYGGGDWTLRIEVVDGIYRFNVRKPERESVDLTFADRTFTNGGITLIVDGPLRLGAFEVRTLK